MAVTRCAEHWKGRAGAFEGVTNNTLRRQWLVVTNSSSDTPYAIASYFAATVGIVYLTPHPDANIYTARNMEIDPLEDTPLAYEVTVTYSSVPIKADEEERQAPNPLDRPARITWDSENAQEFTTKDKDGKAMLNSAGDPLEPVEKDDIRWIIAITKNFASLPSWILSTVNKVNSSQITVSGLALPARSTKVQRLRIGEQQVDNDIPYYEVTVELAYKPSLWDVKRLDEGFNVSSGDGRVPAAQKIKIQIEDDAGEFQDATEAIPLDGAGAVLANPTPTNAVFTTFKIYEEADLNELPFS